MFLSNCHQHTQFCDGKNTMEEMILSALSRGFVSLGFSPHARQNYFYSPCEMSAEEEKGYQAEFDRLNAIYGDKIKLYKGIERDLFSADNCKNYDYIVGSVHYVPSLHGMVEIDFGRQEVLDLIQSEFASNVMDFVRCYYRMETAMVQSSKPDVIGHVDLFLKNIRDLVDTESPLFRDIVSEALEFMVKSDALLEINTGGIARSKQPCPYPIPWTLKRWHELGGRVTVTSDCHVASQIDFAFNQMDDYLKEAGFISAWYLNPKQGDLFTEYQL